MNRCTGACCREFFLPISPVGLRAMYDAASRGEKEATWTEPDGAEITNPIAEDIELIFPMVRCLGYYERAPDSLDLGEDEKESSGGWYYRCVHQEENGDCGIYEIRPSMCRDYPYGKRCRYHGCTWVGGENSTPKRYPSQLAEKWVERRGKGMNPRSKGE